MGEGSVEGVDQLVHAAVRLAQLQDDRDAHRRRQRAEQLAGAIQQVIKQGKSDSKTSEAAEVA